MTKITLYRATDGRDFATKEDCLEYESAGCVEFMPIPRYCDHAPLTESTLRSWMQGDGDCYYATNGSRTRIRPHAAPHPEWATHLVYFGK